MEKQLFQIIKRGLLKKLKFKIIDYFYKIAKKKDQIENYYLYFVITKILRKR